MHWSSRARREQGRGRRGGGASAVCAVNRRIMDRGRRTGRCHRRRHSRHPFPAAAFVARQGGGWGEGEGEEGGVGRGPQKNECYPRSKISLIKRSVNVGAAAIAEPPASRRDARHIAMLSDVSQGHADEGPDEGGGEEGEGRHEVRDDRAACNFKSSARVSGGSAAERDGWPRPLSDRFLLHLLPPPLPSTSRISACAAESAGLLGTSFASIASMQMRYGYADRIPRRGILARDIELRVSHPSTPPRSEMGEKWERARICRIVNSDVYTSRASPWRDSRSAQLFLIFRIRNPLKRASRVFFSFSRTARLLPPRLLDLLLGQIHV